MRQRNASPYCVVPAVPKPAWWSASSPVFGFGAQPRSMLPPKCVKSTTTVTPAHVVAAPAFVSPPAGAKAMAVLAEARLMTSPKARNPRRAVL
jgi:hypothetical protein